MFNKKLNYKANSKIWKKAYSEILEICSKYEDFKDTYGFYDIIRMSSECKRHLSVIELYEKYGLATNYENVKNIDNPLYYTKLHDYCYVASYDENSNRAISWSDDERQPKNEVLVTFDFCTGAYIFGEDYPTEIFDKFFEELKSYNPKYSDSHNHSLYFEVDKAKEIYNKFWDIKKKYEDLYKKYAKSKRIEELKSTLAMLEDKEVNE